MTATAGSPGEGQLPYSALAAQWLRQLRGRRTQAAFSRSLGYSSNVARTWEAADRFPTAAKALWAARRVGHDPHKVLLEFLPEPPPWWTDTPVDTPAGIAHLLRDLKGSQRIVELAPRVSRSRYAIARWLSGAAEPRLPDFFRMIEGCSLRLLDFVACFVDPATLPAVAPRWQRLERARAVAIERPWSHAVLRVVELESYRALPRHSPGFIAARLGISLEEEQQCLALLEQGGQIERRGGRFVPGRPLTVDTRRNPAAGRTLIRFWADTGVARIDAGSKGLFSYNLFTVAEKDLVRLRELHMSYFRQLRAIVAASEPAERVVVANLQLFGLDE